MLLSIGLMFMVGLIMGEIFNKLKLPGFIGMIITGIILGPYGFQLLHGDILSVSGDLRTIALVVILLRAGLNLNINDLKKIGRPAILMAFIPATLELICVVIFAPIFFDITYLEAAILGSVLAAVSPAVVVPKMIKLMDQGYGDDKKIPQLVMASASVDDIYVIVLFTSFISMFEGGSFHISTLINIPIAIALGVVLGVVIGYILAEFFRVFRVRDTIKVLIIIGVSLSVVYYEDFINQFVPLSALLAVMVIGITFLHKSEERAVRLRVRFNKVWVFAELMLFTLVGAAVDPSVALKAGLFALVLLVLQLSFRFLGVQISLIKSKLNTKERLFAGVSYLPKATVQAAIGHIALEKGVPAGELILALAVLSILITAPFGAVGIDLIYKKCLNKTDKSLVEEG
jgi:NhaP-type Na+/H+ or K+/H+ antiporter